MNGMFRDKYGDEVFEGLNASGVKAELVDRGRFEEEIRSGPKSLKLLIGRGSLGLIDILDGGPIRWVNVVRLKRRDKNSGPKYRLVFGIPDVNIPMDHVQFKIKTVRKKAFPVLGNVIDVYWEAKGDIQSLVKMFSDDVDIDKAVTEMGDMSVYTHPNKFQGWTLEVGGGLMMGRFIPTRSRWTVFQKIADHLLSFSSSLKK
jgi:hypothetical protein